MAGFKLALGTAFRPPRTISAMTEEVNRISATAALNISLTSTDESPNIRRESSSGTGKKTRQMKIHSSRGGVAEQLDVPHRQPLADPGRAPVQ